MMKQTSLPGFLVGAGLVAVAAVAAAQEPATGSVKGQTATIQGCVVDGKEGSYVLTHVVETSGLGATPSDPTLKGMSGAAVAGDAAIYWLSSDSAKLIKEHVGHKVEVTGVVTKESTGTVRVKEEPGKSGRDNKVEVQANGHEASAKTESPVTAEPSSVKSDKTVAMPVRRIKVDTVKMLSATCQ